MRNYRLIATVSIDNVCTVKERMIDWAENSGMLSDVQGGFRRGRMTEDNLFIIVFHGCREGVRQSEQGEVD